MNYAGALDKIDRVLSQWAKRHLSPIGKVTVIKPLAVPKLNHIIMTCPSGEDQYMKQVEKKFYDFLWDGKPDKIKCINITQNYFKGGLKMTTINNFTKAIKCTWIRRLLQTDRKPWTLLFETQCCPIKKLEYVRICGQMHDCIHRINSSRKW